MGYAEAMERRDFLLFRPGKTPRSFVLDCEPLYMRYLDSLDDQTTTDLLDSVTRDLQDVKTVRLTRTVWLAREDFRAWIEPLLADLRTRGVHVEIAPA